MSKGANIVVLTDFLHFNSLGMTPSSFYYNILSKSVFILQYLHPVTFTSSFERGTQSR